MTKFAIFITGVCAGVVATAIAVNVFGPGRETVTSPDAEQRSGFDAPSTALLHVNMPQDSVALILGNPVHTSTETLGGAKVDSWQYVAGKDTKATLLFSNGRLNSITYR